MDSIKQFFSISIFDILKYFIVAGSYYVVCYVLYKETLKNAKIQNKEIVEKDIRREIKHSVLSSVIMSVLIFIILESDWVKYTKWYQHVQDYPLWWLPLSVFLGIFIHDTYFYWLHRLLHHKSIFRYTHLVHHQSYNPCPFTSYSFHVVEAIGEGLIVPILLFGIPFHPASLYCFIITAFLINAYGHLGYEIAPKWFRKSVLFQMLNSSVYHNLHHSKFQGNYGLYFRFWDKLMKTENPFYEKEYDKIQSKRFDNYNEQ